MSKMRTSYWATGEPMSHQLLVGIARRWLQATERCQLVRCNSAPALCAEIPDAIGWRLQFPGRVISSLVECKMSLADFYADQHKMSRARGGVGVLRYYLCPSDVIGIEKLPDGWGLLYARQNMVRRVRTAIPRQPTVELLEQEMAFLASMLRWELERWVVSHCLEAENAELKEELAGHRRGETYHDPREAGAKTGAGTVSESAENEKENPCP